MTDTERLAELMAQPEWKKKLFRELGGDNADLLWCAERIAERDAEIARLRESVRITIAGQDWAISHGDSKRYR